MAFEEHASLLRDQVEGVRSTNHNSAFKARIALKTVKVKRTLPDSVQQFDVYPTLITQWRAQLVEGTSGVFGATHATEGTQL